MSEMYFKEHPEAFEELLVEVPIGRAAHPEDYIGVAVFFASEASNYITGQVLFVDGGMTIHQ
jgi:NAD(P)-dependent dehydrogenase (short-subunit alcohol dehydrogenase family)